MPKGSSKKGFTLIELLIVIIIIAVLAATTFVALNPVKRFQDSRDSRRWSDAQAVLAAVHQYIVDNDGTLPAGIGLSASQLGIGGTMAGCSSVGACTGMTASCLNLSTPLAAYLKKLPKDPNGGTEDQTAYSIVRDANNLITVTACNYEGTDPVSVSR